MASQPAWQRHGCYKLGSEQYFNMPLESSLLGCKDDWNSLDHFDPTAAPRRQMAHFMYLRQHFPVLQDGFDLTLWYNNTYYVQLPGSNLTETEIGFWSSTRAFLPAQNETAALAAQQVWLVYTNENSTKTYNIDCGSADWIVAPWAAGTQVRNLFFPFDSLTLSASGRPFNTGKAGPPWQGCAPSLTLDAYGFKAYVPVAIWTDPPPALTKFTPGHDFRLRAEIGDVNATTFEVSFEYNTVMDCNYITQNLKLTASSSGTGGTPTIRTSSVVCGALTNQPLSYLSGDTNSQWSWTATLDNVPDGILQLSLTHVPVQGAPTRTTLVREATSGSGKLLTFGYCATGNR